MRSPEELREDKSVFMNQGEWELLHILSNYKIFSVDNDDYYAEMKFHVSKENIHTNVQLITASVNRFLTTQNSKSQWLHV